jgi:NADH:ubiquinone oxidoreductase subunit 5 (subunit L)/multisubunit Na+/H+ antiporter MnhA subunit
MLRIVTWHRFHHSDLFARLYARDAGKSRYFASLSFFMFSMLGVVLSNNFVMMFIFWELVGVSSYLLIGHWFDRDTAAEAAKKAFLTNRIGDFGFMLGILMAWTATGTVVFQEMAQELDRSLVIRLPNCYSPPDFLRSSR